MIRDPPVIVRRNRIEREKCRPRRKKQGRKKFPILISYRYILPLFNNPYVVHEKYVILRIQYAIYGRLNS